MRKYLFLIVAVLLTTYAFSQRPPRKIEKAFDAQYAGAKDVKWVSEGDRSKEIEWRASYTLAGDEMISTYDYKANWIITIIFIELDELPENIIKAVRDEYMRAEFTRAARLEEPGLSSYGVVIEGADLRMKIQLTKEGKIVRRNLSTEGFD